RLAGGLLHRNVAVEVIDNRRIEGLLLLEQRRDGAPYALDEASAPAGRRRRRELPPCIDRRELLDIRRRRPLRNVGRNVLDRRVETGERLVVLAVGGRPLRLQALQIVRTFRHANQRPTRPSTGLLAVAYSLRGMRPAR